MYFKYLVLFSNGAKWSRNNLVRKFSAAEVDELLELGFIAEIRKTDIGEPVYAITVRGKAERDKKTRNETTR